ncbi:MAG: hypothetical protein AB1941_05890 [Gemmatimonadota bacterium]
MLRTSELPAHLSTLEVIPAVNSLWKEWELHRPEGGFGPEHAADAPFLETELAGAAP